MFRKICSVYMGFCEYGWIYVLVMDIQHVYCFCSEQCPYELKEEDFPPLTFFDQRESSSMFEAQKSTKLAT